jgi:hypothetical protein
LYDGREDVGSFRRRINQIALIRSGRGPQVENRTITINLKAALSALLGRREKSDKGKRGGLEDATVEDKGRAA